MQTFIIMDTHIYFWVKVPQCCQADVTFRRWKQERWGRYSDKLKLSTKSISTFHLHSNIRIYFGSSWFTFRKSPKGTFYLFFVPYWKDRVETDLIRAVDEAISNQKEALISFNPVVPSCEKKRNLEDSCLKTFLGLEKWLEATITGNSSRNLYQINLENTKNNN